MIVLRNDSDLQLLLKKWQHILKLDAWRIKARICRISEMNDANAQGENTWVLAVSQSDIHILDASDFPADSLFEQDMEKTLVHELLHLHFAPFEPEDTDGLEFCAMEQTVELLANLLVQMERRENCSIDVGKIAEAICSPFKQAALNPSLVSDLDIHKGIDV